MSALGWFRLYHRVIDDEKIRLLAFEDRWHFVALCCLKADGLLDEPESDLKWRKVAVKMGVQARELEEICRRLSEVGLVDEYMQPLAWNKLQYKSDTSTDRVRAYREKQNKNNNVTPRNGNETFQKRPQNTETDTDTEVIANAITARGARKSDPKTELMVVLSEEVAAAVVEHRRTTIRKPLTAKAAQLLADQFSRCPNPNAAAETMIAQGWQGFQADWLTERISRGNAPVKENTIDIARRIGWFDADESENGSFRNVELLPANSGRR